MAADPLARVRSAVARFGSSSSGGSGRATSKGIPPGMVGVTITDDSQANLRGLDRIFDAFGATIDDLPKVLADAVPSIRAAHAAVFDTEGAAGRGTWAALAPRTLRDRERLGFPPGPIHYRTGALRAHVLNAPAKITRRGNTVELRIRPADDVDGVPKYRALALGGSPSDIPPRPMVAIGPAQAVKVTSAVQRSLRARARANGLG